MVLLLRDCEAVSIVSGQLWPWQLNLAASGGMRGQKAARAGSDSARWIRCQSNGQEAARLNSASCSGQR